MQNRGRWNRAALRALLCAALVGGAATGCGGGDEPGDGDTRQEAFCPAEQPVRCPDDTCAADTAACPGEDQPAEVSGELVEMRPPSILAHAPEPVEVALMIDDPDALQKMLDDGATLQAELVTASGVQMLDARVAEDDGPDSETTSNYNFIVEIEPSTEDGPQHGGVTISVVTADDETHRLGEGTLRYRGDASALSFEDRESYQLPGLVAADRVWSDDLDGDGWTDHVVSDTDASGEALLRVYRCDAERCEEMGTASLAGAAEDRPGAGIVAADMLTAPDDAAAEGAPTGFLGAVVTERSADGSIATVDVVHLELVAADASVELRETRANVDLREANAMAPLHEQTLAPRLVWDRETSSYRPGVVVTGTGSNEGKPVFTTYIWGPRGPVRIFDAPRRFDGLVGDAVDMAMNGNVATCLPSGQLGLKPAEAPDGMLVSAFGGSDKAMLAVGPIDAAQGPMQVTTIGDRYDDALHGGAFGSVSCRYKDLDGDGVQDLVVALGAADVYAKLGAASGKPATLLVAPGLDKNDVKRGMETAPVLFAGVDAGDWSVFGKEGQLFLRTGRTFDAHGSGDVPAAAILDPDADGDGISDVGETGALTPTLVATPAVPRGVSVVSYGEAGAPAALGFKQGNDRVVRKKPGRKTYQTSNPGGGHVTDSTQVAMSAGSWVRASSSGGVAAGGEGEALLVPGDDKTIIGWLSTTGPFIPLPPSQDGGDAGGLGDLSLIRQTDGAESPTLFAVQTDADGVPSAVRVSELTLQDDAVAEQNVQTVELDLSQVSGDKKKAVKFKAGAELSKAANIAAPGGDEDCDDADESLHPGDACPAPNDVLLVFQAASGEVLTGVLDLESGEPVSVQEAGLKQALLDELGADATADVETKLWVGDFGDGPVAALSGTLRGADGTYGAVVALDRHGKTRRARKRARRRNTLRRGDLHGAGHDQLVECEVDQGSVSCHEVNLIGSDEEAGEETWSEPVSLEGSSVAALVDLDGDGCADLLSDAGEWLSSRCDGQFEQAAIRLDGWSTHLSAMQPATSHNAARSNRSQGIAQPEDTDNPRGALPFFDVLEVVEW